ncbi:hypothetical protein BDF19DRAFT_425690 [Syncephalis fuscata]|nr:hypothetical protein BDF19DRAFT_425690 [Syncephalis fuscata]
MNEIHTLRSLSPVLPPSSPSPALSSPGADALPVADFDSAESTNLSYYSSIDHSHTYNIRTSQEEFDCTGDGVDSTNGKPAHLNAITINSNLPLASPLPSPFGVEDDLLQCELDQLAASFSDSEWSRKLHELEEIKDVNSLRQLVLEKERDLHLAARLGLAVAKKNQHIENRLRAYSHFESETQRKDRWTQEQRERNEEQNERFEMVTRVNAEIRRELELFREDFQAFRKDVTQINGRVDELSSDLQETNRRLNMASKRITGLEGDMATTGEITHDLQGQFESVVSSHRHHLSKTKQTIKDMLHSQSRLVNELERLRDNVSILTDRQHFSEERVSGLIEEYTALLTNAQNTIISLNEAHLEADMHSDHSSSVTQVSHSHYMDGPMHDYHHHNGHGHHLHGSEQHGLHNELTSAMARSESGGQRRMAFVRTPRSQLDLRRPSIGLKDLVKTRHCDPSPNSNGPGTTTTTTATTPSNGINVKNSIKSVRVYTLTLYSNY